MPNSTETDEPHSDIADRGRGRLHAVSGRGVLCRERGALFHDGENDQETGAPAPPVPDSEGQEEEIVWVRPFNMRV